MRKKIRVALLGIPVLILLTSYGIISFKKYNLRLEKNRVYQTGLKTINNPENPYNSSAQLAYYDSLLLLPSHPLPETMILFKKAVCLVKLGREKEAITLLEETKRKLDREPQSQSEKEVMSWLGLAYMRLGERNNCLNHHASQSCIFPIQGNGVYTDPYATQKAIGFFENVLEKDSTDIVDRWFLNIAFMTIGGYPSKVPSKWLIPGLDSNDSAIKVKPFLDMADDLKIAGARTMAGGVIIDDFDNDGYLDIITSSWGLEEGMHYYRNNGDGSFSDRSVASGLSKIKGGLNLIQADYNNDGFTDILVLRGAWLAEFGRQPNTMLKNDGDGTFEDVTVESGILSFNPTQTATWADFNNDGWVDLFIGNETSSSDFPHPSELYINNQDGTFSNMARAAGCEMTAFMKGVNSSDYNNDGWPDIIISTLDQNKILLRNKGIRGKTPQFENATHEARLDLDTTISFPTWFWDFDNDGWPDIFVCGYKNRNLLTAYVAAEAVGHPLPGASHMYLYRNNHDGTFRNVSHQTGLDKSVYAMGANFGDIDNDGWLDMYLGTGNPEFQSLVPNKMFKSVDGKYFADITNAARLGNLQKGHGVAFADIDNDGDQDIFIKSGGAVPGDGYFNNFYINPGQNDNRWISVLLEGTKSNRSAIGARIALRFTDSGIQRTVFMDVNSGGSFGANPLRREIGIGRAKQVDELKIVWPGSGTIQVFKNLAPDEFIKITEGKNEIVKMNLRITHFKDMTGNSKMIDCAPVK
ncbi:MAG TPA: CRTAC1 family protein [Puia sp.]